MTVIRVLELIASSRGGGAAHVHYLALGLPPGQFQVQVAMAEDGGNVTRRSFEEAGIAFHGLRISQGIPVQALGRLRALAAHADVLHAHGSRAALFGRIVAVLARRRPRFVYTIHGFAAPHYPTPKRQALLLIERALAAVTDAWICVSDAERESLRDAGVASPQRTRVIHNGIDTTAYAPSEEARRSTRRELHLTQGDFVVTTVCRLYRPRDLRTLLHAFRLATDAGFRSRLLIVGDGPERAALTQLAAELQLAPYVAILGMRQDVARILSASDLFVLSSRGWEGLPLTVLEAMAARLPVIASDVGGTKEAVLNGETGYLFAPGNVQQLTQRLRELASNPALAASMGQRGQDRVRRLFPVTRMVRETGELYRSLLDRGSTA